jgi:nanoRNase/pAp phosphatase (c-di-AMP/oligoRNAs hydrolase)
VIVSILGAFLVTTFYSPHGKVSVRRKVGTDIKCDMITRRLNGGGHSYAAGIRVIKELQTIL